MGKLKNNSQNDKILRYLKTHKRGITPMQAISMFKITCLAERIRDLRERGYKIETIMHYEKQQDGTVKQYGQYILREA